MTGPSPAGPDGAPLMRRRQRVANLSKCTRCQKELLPWSRPVRSLRCTERRGPGRGCYGIRVLRNYSARRSAP